MRGHVDLTFHHGQLRAIMRRNRLAIDVIREIQAENSRHIERIAVFLSSRAEKPDVDDESSGGRYLA